jgi:hypothetical protein
MQWALHLPSVTGPGRVDDTNASLWHGPVSPAQAREMRRKCILDAIVTKIGEPGL